MPHQPIQCGLVARLAEPPLEILLRLFLSHPALAWISHLAVEILDGPWCARFPRHPPVVDIGANLEKHAHLEIAVEFPLLPERGELPVCEPPETQLIERQPAW